MKRYFLNLSTVKTIVLKLGDVQYYNQCNKLLDQTLFSIRFDKKLTGSDYLIKKYVV